jgi:hypothetical protein
MAYTISDLLERSPLMLVAEEEDHAIVAVRVNKKWLANNLKFIEAIADVATRGEFDE